MYSVWFVCRALASFTEWLRLWLRVSVARTSDGHSVRADVRAAECPVSPIPESVFISLSLENILLNMGSEGHFSRPLRPFELLFFYRCFLLLLLSRLFLLPLVFRILTLMGRGWMDFSVFILVALPWLLNLCIRAMLTDLVNFHPCFFKYFFQPCPRLPLLLELGAQVLDLSYGPAGPQGSVYSSVEFFSLVQIEYFLLFFCFQFTGLFPCPLRSAVEPTRCFSFQSLCFLTSKITGLLYLCWTFLFSARHHPGRLNFPVPCSAFPGTPRRTAGEAHYYLPRVCRRAVHVALSPVVSRWDGRVVAEELSVVLSCPFPGPRAGQWAFLSAPDGISKPGL